VVAGATFCGSVTAWNALIGHTRGVDSIVYSPAGSPVLTASLDQTDRLWQASDGRLLRISHTCPACTDPAALLALARTSQQEIHGLTTLEAAASAGAA
jgi:WD40 repeat protein